MLMAIDYWEETEGDLAQLALRTIKIGGLLCSLDNKAPKEIETHKKEIETHKGPALSTYKELAELAKKEDLNGLLDEIAQKNNSISEIRSSIIEEYKKVPHSAKLDSLIKERETISTQLDPLEKEAQIYESKKHELYDEIKTISKSILELVEKGYDEDKYNILRQQQEKKEQERNTNDKALEKVLEKRLAMMQKDNEIGEEIKKEETGIQSPNIASLKQQIDTLQKEVDQLNADVDAINKKNKTNFEAFAKEGEELTAYTVISEKTADISATAFKDLMKKARGDNRKIGILFCPLFYPLDLHLYPQLKQRMSQSEKAKETLKFNPFSYFKVTYKLGQKYKTFFD
jgi:chromosome segregation ATPase